MKYFFKDVFAYHHHFNKQFIDDVKCHLDDLPDRVTLLLSHNINAHQVWNARIIGSNFTVMKEEYPLNVIRDLDKQNYHSTIDIIEKRDLNDLITYQNSKGDSFSNSIRDILYHVANHHTHHRGQVISDIRQSGFAPIPSDYILFKR